ncbi:MAG: uroporphyrinogen decarboxylase family protein [Duncaniella sp.]|nr:uroporphyrinogen decarboxylase family protein [Duncaniella sp.]
MKIDMTRWMKEIIDSNDVKAIPVMTHPGIEIIGKTVREAVTDGEVHHQAIVALAEKYPTAAATVIMDLTVEAEAFGATISFPENEVPAVMGHMLDTPDDIERLTIPSLKAGRVPQYLKANLLAARSITDRPVLGGCIGPFSLAGRLYDMSEIMVLIYQNPEAAHTLLAKCTEFILRYCKAMKETGVNGVVLAEPAAGLMSDEDCRRFSSDYVKKIVDAVQDDTFTVVLHNCGNTGHCTGAMVATGASAYHFGNKCDMEEVTRDVPPTALAMGNLDPVSVFKEATPEKMKEATRDLLEKMKPYRNFVLSSGCDTPPHTPLANIDTFFETLKEYNGK